MAEWVGAYAIPGKPFIIWAMMLTILPPCSFIQAWYTGREREREERREGGGGGGGILQPFLVKVFNALWIVSW